MGAKVIFTPSCDLIDGFPYMYESTGWWEYDFTAHGYIPPEPVVRVAG
jgi:hypothetical protein